MSSRRIEQVNSLIRERLGQILLKEFEVPEGTLLTVSSVHTSNDRDHATITVSIYPSERAAALFETLTRKQGYVQHLLNQELVMEHVPTIHFRLDTLEEHAASVEALIDRAVKE